MSPRKPTGAIQVDVDELWVYYESIGLRPPKDAGTPVYAQGIPRLLELLDRFDIRATFFVCGRDLPAQASAVAEISRRGILSGGAPGGDAGVITSGSSSDSPTRPTTWRCCCRPRWECGP